MKRILTLIIISGGLILTSCSLSRNTGMSSNLNSQKLEARQALAVNNAIVKGTATKSPAIQLSENPIKTQSIAVNPEKIRSVSGNSKKSFAKSNIVKKSTQFLTQTISMSNLDKTTGALLAKKNSNTAAWDPGSMSSDHYLRLWIICGIAALIFLLLCDLAVHIALLYTIFGILLLIALAGFLLFIGLWLWRKNQAG